MKTLLTMMIALICVAWFNCYSDGHFCINNDPYQFPYAQIFHVRKNNFELARFTTDQFYPIVFTQSLHTLNAEESNQITGDIIYLEFYNSDSSSFAGHYSFDYYINSEIDLYQDRDLNVDSIIDTTDIYEVLVPGTAIIDLDNSFYAFDEKNKTLEDLIYDEDTFHFNTGEIKIKQIDADIYLFIFNCSGDGEHHFKGSIKVNLRVKNVDLYIL